MKPVSLVLAGLACVAAQAQGVTVLVPVNPTAVQRTVPAGQVIFTFKVR
jgi:hypothetical protein